MARRKVMVTGAAGLAGRAMAERLRADGREVLAVIKADDESGLTVHDVDNKLQWSFKYFDNLHMDLGTFTITRQHLHDAIER